MTERALIRTQTAVAENRDQLQYVFQGKVEGIRSELYNFAYRLTGNREDAEDLLQESYFKAFKYFHQLRDRDKFKEWIFQITANQFRNSLKKKKREQLYFTDDYEKIGAMPQKKKYNPDVVAEKGDRAIRLHHAIASLDPKMREALVLFELQGFSIEETAKILAISPGTVKSRLHYARKRLKSRLLETDFGKAVAVEYADDDDEVPDLV